MAGVIEDTVYYQAHCSGCGETTTADLLAFDFGVLVNKAIEKADSRDFGASDKWIDLLKIDLGMYFTWRDLAQHFGLREGEFSNFKLTVRDLKWHLKNLTGYDVDKDLIPLDDTNNQYYNRLIRKIKTPLVAGKKLTHQDIDKNQHADNIWNVINKLTPPFSTEDEVIVEFQVKVIMSNDDNGNPFPKSLEVIYEDERTDSVINNVCPHCGKIFYSEVGKYEEIIICMAGSARVGKTAYLAALVNRINELGSASRRFATVVPSTDPEWLYFKSRILDNYIACRKIDKTAFEGDGETIPLFSLEIAIQRKHYIFTFIDMPGEAYDSSENPEAGKDFINNDRKIVKHAQMIWCCIDPVQISSELAALAKLTTSEQDRVNANTSSVMGNIKNTMTAVCGGTRKNAAVLITKSDTILGGGENADDLLFDPDINGFDTVLREDMSLNYDEIVKYQKSAGDYLDAASQITITLEGMFEKYTVFSVAAYGKDVSNSDIDAILMDDHLAELMGEDTEGRINPSLVELPFIWTLAALGKIDAYKMVPRYKEKGFGPFRREVFMGSFPEKVEIEELYRAD